MAKRKNGGGDYQKVKGSNGNGDAKSKSAIDQAVAAMMIGMSTPLQSRAGDFMTNIGYSLTPDEAAKMAAFSRATGSALSRAASKGGLLSDTKRADDFLSSTPMRNADIIKIAGQAVSKAAKSIGSKNE